MSDIYYYCTCKKDNKTAEAAEGMHITTANKEGICMNCGYYAVASTRHIRGNIVDLIVNNFYDKPKEKVCEHMWKR